MTFDLDIDQIIAVVGPQFSDFACLHSVMLFLLIVSQCYFACFTKSSSSSISLCIWLKFVNYCANYYMLRVTKL